MSIEEILPFNEDTKASIYRGPGADFANSTQELLVVTRCIDNDLGATLLGLDAAVEGLERTVSIDKEVAQGIKDATDTIAEAARLVTSSEFETTHIA